MENNYENAFMGIQECVAEIRPLNAKKQDNVITMYFDFSESSKRKLAEINRTKRSIEKNSKLFITNLTAEEKDLARLESEKMYTGTFSTLIRSNSKVFAFRFEISSFCFEFTKIKNQYEPVKISNVTMTVLQKDDCITVTTYES